MGIKALLGSATVLAFLVLPGCGGDACGEAADRLRECGIPPHNVPDECGGDQSRCIAKCVNEAASCEAINTAPVGIHVREHEGAGGGAGGSNAADTPLTEDSRRYAQCVNVCIDEEPPATPTSRPPTPSTRDAEPADPDASSSSDAGTAADAGDSSATPDAGTPSDSSADTGPADATTDGADTGNDR